MALMGFGVTAMAVVVRLSVEATSFHSAGDPIEREHVSGGPIIDLVKFGVADDRVEALYHNLFEPVIHFAFGPEEALPVLY